MLAFDRRILQLDVLMVKQRTTEVLCPLAEPILMLSPLYPVWSQAGSPQPQYQASHSRAPACPSWRYRDKALSQTVRLANHALFA